MNTAERNPLYGIKARKLRADGDASTAWLDTIGQTPADMDFVPGQRLFFWIGQAAKQRREEHGLSLEAVAAQINRGKETLDRFEKGRTRPHELEAMLVGYAKLTELEDPRDIVAAAVRLWYQAGVNPAVPQPAEEVIHEARQKLAEGRRQAPRAPRAKKSTGR